MTSVRVAVRARPFSEREQASCSHYCLEMTGKKTTLGNSGEGHAGRGSAKEFRFDHSYWSVNEEDAHYVGQEQVYFDLGLPVIESAFAGYNSCVFAYGQTGSGKTYTMTGSGSNPGLMPRICKGLFAHIEGSGGDRSYRTELSYMEIYNEKVRDLLEGGRKAGLALRVREHPKEGPYVEGLSRHKVHDYTGIAALLSAGNSLRATASTRMNESSSRSHAIFTLTTTQAVLECGLPSEKRSKLHLVDLAGSERASATGAEGLRLKEGGSINKSLVCLGTVISALADKAAHRGKKTPHIPYRDSVLTYLLKDSLGGNAKTIMIATVSPADSSYGETLSTLRYASRARAIVNKPVVNEDSSVKVIRELRSEIERLRAIITTQHLSVDVVPGSQTTGKLVEDLHKKEEQVVVLTKEWASKWKEIQQLLKAHDVALHSDGAKLVVHSDQPHLVGIDPDILSTGLVFLYLKEDCTTVGSLAASPPPDITVAGADIAHQHCRLVVERGKVFLCPLNGDCYINRCQVTTHSRLRQGDLLQLGGSAVFRFNHPQEAKRLRKRHSEGLLDPHRLARQHPHRKRTKSTSHALCHSPHSPPPSSPQQHSTPTTASVSVVELRSQAVVSAVDPTPPTTSLTFSGLEQGQKSHLSLPLDEGQSLEEWNSLSLVKIAMSPLTVLKTLVTPHSVATLPDQTALTQDTVESGPVKTQSSSWWRRLLYTLLLLCNAPLLVAVVGTLTLPACSMLAVLLSSVKLCALLQKCWLSRWLGTLLALLVTVLATPVAGLCNLVFRISLHSLSALRLVPLPPSSKPAQSMTS